MNLPIQKCTVVGINSHRSLTCKSLGLKVFQNEILEGDIHVYSRRLCDWQKKLDVGDNVSMEIPLVDFATKKSINLQTLIRPGVPLVLNFGSCT